MVLRAPILQGVFCARNVSAILRFVSQSGVGNSPELPGHGKIMENEATMIELTEQQVQALEHPAVVPED